MKFFISAAFESFLYPAFLLSGFTDAKTTSTSSGIDSMRVKILFSRSLAQENFVSLLYGNHIFYIPDIINIFFSKFLSKSRSPGLYFFPD